MRVLYVALTRARQRLILVGTAPLAALQADQERYVGQAGPLPLLDRQTAGSMLSWLRKAICCQSAEKVSFPGEVVGTKAPLFAVQTYEAEQMRLWVIDPPQRAGVLERSRLCATASPLPASARHERSNVALDRVVRRLTTPYPAAALTAVPAVVAASVLKRRWNTILDQEDPAASWIPSGVHQAASQLPRHILRRPEFLDQSPRADPAAVGTWTHELMQRLDFRRPCDESDLRAQAQTLIQAGVFLPAQTATIEFENIAWFLQTELGRRVRAENTKLFREWPFVLGVDPRQYQPSAAPQEPQDLMLVRGIIDCLFDAGGGWEVLDYKTDAVAGEQLVLRAAEYRGQLQIYAAAVAAAWKQAATARWLVFLSSRQIVEA
jgi:ATP-dependent helicase/nuclease subunit A